MSLRGRGFHGDAELLKQGFHSIEILSLWGSSSRGAGLELSQQEKSLQVSLLFPESVLYLVKVSCHYEFL